MPIYGGNNQAMGCQPNNTTGSTQEKNKVEFRRPLLQTAAFFLNIKK